MNTELMNELTAQPWAIMPATLGILLDAAANGTPFAEFPKDASAEEQMAFKAAMQQRRQTQQAGAIAVIPIAGVIHPKRSAIEDVFGLSFGTALDSLVAQTRAAVENPGIKAIVFDVNSPGGSTFGLPEAASELAKMRGQKPTIAVSNHVNASAAYWLSASVADEIVASPSSVTGSVGIMATHRDLSGMAEKEGIKVTILSAGANKADGHEFAPLSEDARTHAQRLLDDLYGQFVGAVAQGRGVSAATVRGAYGEGRVLTAKDAKAAGMVDRVGTLRETLARLGGAAEGGMRGEVAFSNEQVRRAEAVAAESLMSEAERNAAAEKLIAELSRDADLDLRERRHRLLTR